LSRHSSRVACPVSDGSGKRSSEDRWERNCRSWSQAARLDAGAAGGRAKEALAELEEKPDSQLNQYDLRTQLAKLLEKQPDLVPQLRELLSDAQAQTEVMNQNVGAGGKASQIKGDRNTASIS